jgi:citrate lyase subunit beta/citryl-CoA lyase
LVVIHPSHVAVAHEIFTPDSDTVEYYRRLLEAYREAERAGSSAVDFEGQHIDIAHVKTAEEIITRADAVAANA